MVTSTTSKPFEAFANAIDKANQAKDKIKDFAEKTFSSIKNIEVTDIKNVPSKIFNFVKENKFTTALATLSIAISAVVFVNVSATAAILFLGAISFVKAYAYTREYVKSTDYQFRKLANDYFNSIEALCRNFNDGEQLRNNLVMAKMFNKFGSLQSDLTTFLLNNAKSYDQIESWKKYLKETNPKLLIFRNSFPRHKGCGTIIDAAFEPIQTDNSLNKEGREPTKIHCRFPKITVNEYIDQVFIYVINKEKDRFKDELKSLVGENNPRSSSLKKDILNNSKITQSFLLNGTKKEIALEVYQEIKPTLSSRIKNVAYKPFEFMKRFNPFPD